MPQKVDFGRYLQTVALKLFSQLLYALSTFQLFINENSNGTLNPKMPQTDEFYSFITEVEKTFYFCD